jgi:hypothetical protein
MNADPVHLERLTRLTTRYASFSSKSVGLGYVAAALLILTGFFAARALPDSLLGSVAGIVVTLVLMLSWQAVRVSSRRLWYQRHGEAKPLETPFNRAFLFGLGVGVALGFVAAWGLSRLAGAGLPDSLAFSLPALLVAAAVAFLEYRRGALTPALTLLLLGASVAGGINADAPQLSALQRAVQLLAILGLPAWLAYIGIREHLEHARLERELEQLRSP